MVICLMPMMAFADDTTTGATVTGLSQFSDADSIKNKEAVAVLVGLGVIDGMGDGTFQPEANLTRAQASKLVATVVKSGDKSEIPAPAADPFTDVTTAHWAAGAIQFGVDNDYINGMGDGTFHPDDNVTTAQLATMLEKLLGFSVADVNYNWPENAMAIAQGGQANVSVYLLDEITKGAVENLTRDDAAQMIFNALLSDDVVKSSTTGSSDVDGNTRYTRVVSSKEGYLGFVDGFEQLIEKYFPKATYAWEESEADPFGRPATAWKNGREKITDEVIATPDYTYTAEMTAKDLKADLDGYRIDTNIVLENGDPVEFAPDLEGIAALTANGALVELYANEKDTAIEQVIAAYYEPANVTDVNAKNETVTVQAGGQVDITVTADDDAYELLSSLEKDAKVLVAINDAFEIIDAYVPTEVTGAITKITNKDVVTLGGTDYELQVFAPIANFRVDANDNGTGYLDKYGYLVDYASEKVVSESADWLLVKDVYSNTSTSTTDKYVEDGNVTTTVYYVQGVNEAGEVVDLQLNTKAEGEKGSTPETAETLAWAEEQLVGAEEGTASDGSAVKAIFFPEGFLVTYTETANGYTISDADDLSEAVDVDVIDAGAAKIDGNYVSKDVKTIIVTGEKASEVTATVTQGVEAIEDGACYILDKTDEAKPLVRTIFAGGVAEAQEEPDVLRFDAPTAEIAYTDANGKNQIGYEVAYYSEDNAEPQTIIVTDPIAAGWYTCEALEGVEGVYELTEYVAGADSTVQTKDDDTVQSTYGTTVTMADGVYYNIADAAVRDLREDGTIASVSELEAGLQVAFAYTTDEKTNVNTITQLYVVADAAEAEEPAAPAEA